VHRDSGATTVDSSWAVGRGQDSGGGDDPPEALLGESRGHGKSDPIDPRLGFRQLAAMGRDVLAVEEQQALEESGEPRLFYRYWTLKESYLKFLGCGFSGAPASFGLVEVASGWRVRDAVEDAPRFVTCDLDADHPAAVCTRAEIVEPVRYLSAAGVLTAVA